MTSFRAVWLRFLIETQAQYVGQFYNNTSAAKCVRIRVYFRDGCV